MVNAMALCYSIDICIALMYDKYAMHKINA